MTMKEITLNIEGMHCEHCVMTVFKALRSVDGVVDVEVSLANKNAKIKYDEKRASPDEMSAAIVNAGYTVV